MERTGKTGSVLGYACDVFDVTWPNGDKGEGCVAKDVHVPQLAPTYAILGLGDSDLIPLRNVTMDAAGKEKSRMEVTKIDKAVPDDTRFAIPASYKTQHLEDMDKGLHPR